MSSVPCHGVLDPPAVEQFDELCEQLRQFPLKKQLHQVLTLHRSVSRLELKLHATVLQQDRWSPANQQML
jgi:hypothetical protein